MTKKSFLVLIGLFLVGFYTCTAISANKQSNLLMKNSKAADNSLTSSKNTLLPNNSTADSTKK